MLHAIEKPMNLEVVKPFANTSDFVKKTPIIHTGEGKKQAEKKKNEEKMEIKIDDNEGEESGEKKKR